MNKKPSKFSPEVRARVVRLIREQGSEHPSMWAGVESISPMIGCMPQTLLDWVKRDEVDHGERDDVSTAEREHICVCAKRDEFLQPEIRRVWQANMQADLDAWLDQYNNGREHQGRWCYGKTPMRTFLDSLELAREKIHPPSMTRSL